MSQARAADVVLSIAVDRVRHLWRSPMVVVATLLSAGLAIASSVVGAQGFAARQQQHTNLVKQLVRNQLQDHGLLTGRTTELALRAIRPPAVGLVIVHGDDDQIPVYVDFSPAGSLQARTPSVEGSTGDLGGGDLEPIVRLLGGLMAIALGLQTVMHGKQTGWLWSLQSLPVQPWQIILGLWVGCCVVIGSGLVLCVSVAVGTASLTLDDGTRELIPALARALPTWLLYLGIMTALGIGLASWARRQVRAYGAMLVCWLVFAWIGPQFVVTVSQLIGSATPRLSMETDRADDYANAERAAEDALGRAIADRHPATQTAIDEMIIARHTDLDELWRQEFSVARQRATAREVEWTLQRDRRDQFVRALTVLFPGGLAGRGAADALDTGDVVARAWRQAIAAQQTRYEQLLFDDRPVATLRTHIDYIKGVSQMFVLVRRPRPGLATMPLFQTPSIPSSARRSALLQTNALLLVHLGLALGLALRVRAHQLRPAD
jgi:hypothetical protein